MLSKTNIPLFKEVLKETGDLRNIQPYAIDSKTSHSITFHTEARWKVVAAIEEIALKDVEEDVKISPVFFDHYNDRHIINHTKKLFNVSYTVEGTETQHQRSNLKTYFRIMKTVVEFVIDFIKHEKPFGVFIFPTNKEVGVDDKGKYTFYSSVINHTEFPGYAVMDAHLLATNKEGFLIYKTKR